MTISNFRATEPLYLVIIRDRNAEQLLKDWARASNAQVKIEGNRMHLFEQRTFDLFQMNWTGGWTTVTIWDCWNRRHIYNN